MSLISDTKGATHEPTTACLVGDLHNALPRPVLPVASGLPERKPESTEEPAKTEETTEKEDKTMRAAIPFLLLLSIPPVIVLICEVRRLRRKKRG